MKIIEVKELYNKYQDKKDFQREDDRYWGEIEVIADNLKDKCESHPILLLSGPSGSGKTTTAQRIEKMLDKKGFETHTVSLDCYFKSIEKEDVPKVDLESPERLDNDLLSEHIDKLLKYEEIELPEFDFANTKQIKSGIKLRRKPNEIIIFEGIHALNPEAVSVSAGVSKMYISARSRYLYGEDKILHPRFIRLLRRIDRDVLGRGRSPEDTLAFFKSVERGVDKYVSPYKIYADYSINTSIEYEPLIYRTLLFEKLKETRQSVRSEDRETLELLIEFLQSFEGRESSLVPKGSLIREFIGNE